MPHLLSLSAAIAAATFATADGKAHFAPVPLPARPAALGGAAFWVSTRRGKQFNSMVQSSRDALTGLWSRFDPAQLASEGGFRANPARVDEMLWANPRVTFFQEQLLPESETGDLRRQWDTIQTGFVDEPRRASGSNHH